MRYGLPPGAGRAGSGESPVTELLIVTTVVDDRRVTNATYRRPISFSPTVRFVMAAFEPILCVRHRRSYRASSRSLPFLRINPGLGEAVLFPGMINICSLIALRGGRGRLVRRPVSRFSLVT